MNGVETAVINVEKGEKREIKGRDARDTIYDGSCLQRDS